MSSIPAAVVHALRDPVPSEADFTPTKFCPAASKAWFAAHWLRFASSDFPKHHFTQRFYAQLMHTSGHIAHFNRAGFWTEFFASTAGKVEFLEQTITWPCHGSPEHTWCDVERVLTRRLRSADLLGHLRRRLGTERDAAERAEFARLRAKYAGDTPRADPGVLRTVPVPANVQARERPARRQGDTTQLALGFG